MMTARRWATRPRQMPRAVHAQVAVQGDVVVDAHQNVFAAREHLDQPYPGGESWRQATDRVDGAIDDICARYDGARVLVVGHVATRWALEQRAGENSLEQLATEDFAWQEGWEFVFSR